MEGVRTPPMRFPVGAAPLLGLYVLSTLLLDCPHGEDVLLLVSCAVPTCGPCDLAAAYLVRNGTLVRSPAGWLLDDQQLDKQVAGLDGADGRVDLPGRLWSGALALRGPGGLQGYLVASAQAVPAPDVMLRLRLFARHAGTTIAAIGANCRNTARQDQALTGERADVALSRRKAQRIVTPPGTVTPLSTSCCVLRISPEPR